MLGGDSSHAWRGERASRDPSVRLLFKMVLEVVMDVADGLREGVSTMRARGPEGSRMAQAGVEMLVGLLRQSR